MLSIGILCASFSALIELPLAWLRSRGSARIFLFYVSARALVQTAVMALTLTQGYGAFGVIAGNAAVDAIFSSILLIRQYKETGIRFDTNILARAARYGWPLLGGAIAMFILGNCDRWFLAGVVSKEALAHYALAAKLATIVALSMQPFGLWWNARRMRILMEPGGYQTSANAITWGFACLSIGTIWVATGVPPLIRIALPEAYHPAIELMPWLILIVAMNETSSLFNVSAYLGKSAAPALVINGCGAAIALAGYILLAPAWGVSGAIAATIAGHSVRLLAYVLHGARHAPIPYNWTTMIIIGLIALYASQSNFSQKELPVQVLFLFLSSISIVAIAIRASRGRMIAPQLETA
jgi:O-antigen/teichoic acid export membrane protein